MGSKLSEIIDEYLKENNLTLREFAKKCELSHSYIAKLRKGYDPRSKNIIEPTIDTLKKIASAMDMELEELLRKAEYLEKDEYIMIDDDLPMQVRELGVDYITVTKELKDRGLTPEEIKKIGEFIAEIKNKH